MTHKHTFGIWRWRLNDDRIYHSKRNTGMRTVSHVPSVGCLWSICPLDQRQTRSIAAIASMNPSLEDVNPATTHSNQVRWEHKRKREGMTPTTEWHLKSYSHNPFPPLLLYIITSHPMKLERRRPPPVSGEWFLFILWWISRDIFLCIRTHIQTFLLLPDENQNRFFLFCMNDTKFLILPADARDILDVYVLRKLKMWNTIDDLYVMAFPELMIMMLSIGRY